MFRFARIQDPGAFNFMNVLLFLKEDIDDLSEVETWSRKSSWSWRLGFPSIPGRPSAFWRGVATLPEAHLCVFGF